ncbi:NADP-dependent phosphogluconate dehydrogenase [Nocardioides lianchengensis]|uniref:6-phosphogluconate dehydrogenase, decarboxylating n=1 Tax=Nocardioides lianchengensis TaxID=1045774 RepID=A0A1G6I664_9ACTN|nr:NADP-dependent phosphogluconate dehydrogenase [Nocardioides lianchengensis]NYG13169.1 6-phosphogluconate dehydrogenase [Nocardioides lianchengensis]SDC01525.1 6-phosphogluconate dehydrogenase [Nocardioides lianchengensis]
MAEQQATIGVTGLAVMGRNLARNIARHGHVTAVHNRTFTKTEALVDEFGDEGTFVASESLEDFVKSIETPRAIIIMVKAGEPTDAVIDELVPLLDEGDIVVDGGNAHFADTVRREQALSEKGLHFVGMGVSGGEEGALHGPSIMVGGSEHAYERLGPIVESIAAQVDGTPCAAHVGPDAAGHFVKMVHNGIEYADMQLIAEAYDLLRSIAGLSPAEIADVFEEWNGGDLESFLIEMTADVLRHTDGEGGQPFVDVVLDEAEQKGTGRWTVQAALDLGVPVTGIAEATFARSLSGHTEQRAAAREVFTTDPDEQRVSVDRDVFVDQVRAALYASKVVAYAQGFDQIAAGAEEHGWDVDLGSVATIWRGGCIIRAQFLDRIKDAYAEEPDLTTLLTTAYFADAVKGGVDAWREVVATAARGGVPVPAFGSSLSYFDGLRRERLPAALIQALRDDFGAHTYRRVDREGTFHTLWAGDRSEQEI